jgi:hypothetical protein
VRTTFYGEGILTLLCDKNTLISLLSNSDFNKVEALDELYVHASSLSELVGDTAIWLNEDLLLLPSIESDEWTKLLEKANSKKIENIFEHGFDPENDPFEGEMHNIENTITLSNEDIDVLIYAPVIVFGAVPDNHPIISLTHCFSCFNCAFGFGVLKRHSHSFKNSGKCSFGTPLNLRKCRFAWFQKFSIPLM